MFKEGPLSAIDFILHVQYLAGCAGIRTRVTATGALGACALFKLYSILIIKGTIIPIEQH